MHPALSVIFFTVVSGCGYGLLFLLGLSLLVDPHLLVRSEVVVLLLVGAGAAAAGLTSSLLHLGQPQRAWRALSQWRSSWLSREGVSALASFVPVLALGLAIWNDADLNIIRATALLLALLAATTVYCTAQIYASLKTIRAWHNAYVTPGYFLLGLYGGTAWLLFVHCWLFSPPYGPFWPGLDVQPVYSHPVLQFLLGLLLALLATICGWWKILYWRYIDRAPGFATIESATGLGRFGTVRSVEAPHTEENYLTNEMGFVLARKHARHLRSMARILIIVIPLIAFLVLWLAGMTWSPIFAVIATIAVTAGSFVERWLFFAEAKHVVMLYYSPRNDQT
jgi:DMSO reductase anchor subunit